MSFIPLSKADIDILEKEKREIERRRNAELKRKKYFFNEKERNLGIDSKFIAQQIKDKENKKQLEIKKDEEYRQKIDSFVDKLTILNNKRNEFYKKRSYEIGQFQKNTKLTDCDTFDLNDPNTLKKNKPPRINDIDKIPLCAIQKFDGEDLKKNDRIKKQQKEIQNWCQQIINQRNENIKNEQECIKKYVDERNQHLIELENIEKAKTEKLKKNTILCSNENKITAAIPKEKIYRDKQESLAQIEIKQMLKSKFLNEKWDSTLRSDNKNRFIPYNFKGFSQTQRQNILNTQSSQINDKIKYKKDLKKQEMDYYKQQQQYHRNALLQLRNAQRLKQERKQNLGLTHRQQIDDFKQKTSEINKIYENKVTPDYFQQFQTSTR